MQLCFQVDLLREMLAESHPQLEIRTVDGFQGREKEAVVLSLVRSNCTGQVGFVSDVRRLNVAVTRARRHLCVVTDTVTTGKSASGFVEYMETTAEVRSAREYQQELYECRTGQFQNRAGQVKDPVGQVHRRGDEVKGRGEVERELVKIKLKGTIDNWIKDGEVEFVFDASLSALHRRIVHEIAEELGLGHESRGQDRQRRIVVSKRAGEIQIGSIVDDEAGLIADGPSMTTNPPTCPSGTVNPTAGPSGTADRPTGLSMTLKPKTKPSKSDNRPSSTVNPVTVPPPESKPKRQLITKPNETTKKKTTEPDDDLIKCELCAKNIPKANLTLHKLRCVPVRLVTSSQAQSLVKPRPWAAEDDDLINQFQTMDSVCHLKSCKKSTNLMGQICNFCKRIFCLSHHLAEVHGCTDAARQHARSQMKQPTSVASTSQKDAIKRAQLQQKLDKKIQDLSTKRTGPTKKLSDR